MKALSTPFSPFIREDLGQGVVVRYGLFTAFVSLGSILAVIAILAIRAM